MDNEGLKKHLIEEYCSLIREEEGLTVYELKTKQKQNDEENKIQILSIGPENNSPIKSVLLMGETGAGKTRIINAMVNHLYGVTFEDSFRFLFKDQLEYSDKHHTESQTDYITAYIIYHQDGMLNDSNYMLIDTPGFGDTRSEYHQKLAMEHLRTFLTEDYGIDDLNCIGLVAKANQNRISGFQRVILVILEKPWRSPSCLLPALSTSDYQLVGHGDEENVAPSAPLDAPPHGPAPPYARSTGYFTKPNELPSSKLEYQEVAYSDGNVIPAAEVAYRDSNIIPAAPACQTTDGDSIPNDVGSIPLPPMPLDNCMAPGSDPATDALAFDHAQPTHLDPATDATKKPRLHDVSQASTSAMPTHPGPYKQL